MLAMERIFTQKDWMFGAESDKMSEIWFYFKRHEPKHTALTVYTCLCSDTKRLMIH